MKCRNCKRELPENSLFCNWCGVKQIKERNEISIPKPTKNSTGYHGQVMVDGKRVRVSGKTEKEYREKALAYKTKETIPTEKKKLDDCISDYINSNSATLSPATLRGYDQIYRCRFQDYMAMQIQDINWQKMINDEAKKVAPKTVKNGWGLVTAALSYAGYNMPSVNLPKVPVAKTDFLDHKQILTFIQAVRGEPCETAALLALHSLRLSEIYHLNADDISNDTIHVRGATVRDKGNNWVDKDTNKNRTSTRDIPIIIPRLKQILPESGRVVTMPQTSIRQNLEKVCKDNGLPVVSVHDLRRSFASLCAYLRWQPESICALGGWRQGSPVVHDIYIKISNRGIAEDVQRMRDYISKNK